jgi:hypothetical protein
VSRVCAGLGLSARKGIPPLSRARFYRRAVEPSSWRQQSLQTVPQPFPPASTPFRQPRRPSGPVRPENKTGEQDGETIPAANSDVLLQPTGKPPS